MSRRELFHQFGGTVHRVQQRSDVGFTTSQRLQGGDPDQRGATEIEEHRGPARSGPVGTPDGINDAANSMSATKRAGNSSGPANADDAGPSPLPSVTK